MKTILKLISSLLPQYTKEEHKMKIYTDKSHNRTADIFLLTYEQQQSMKQFWDVKDAAILIDYAKFNRFLNTLNPFIIGPSFAEYISWKEIFHGWSYGKITTAHSAYQYCSHLTHFPMNAYYK